VRLQFPRISSTSASNQPNPERVDMCYSAKEAVHRVGPRTANVARDRVVELGSRTVGYVPVGVVHHHRWATLAVPKMI
jgi:hypothetical protein